MVPTIDDNLSRGTPPRPCKVFCDTGEVAGVGEPGADNDEVSLRRHNDPILVLRNLPPVFDPGEPECQIQDMQDMGWLWVVKLCSDFQLESNGL